LSLKVHLAKFRAALRDAVDIIGAFSSTNPDAVAAGAAADPKALRSAKPKPA
jgi:hypothetical protein